VISVRRDVPCAALAALLLGVPPARAVAQGLPPARDSLAERLAEVRHLTAEERWADALTALGPLVHDSASRALAARLAVNAGLAALRAGDTTAAQSFWERAMHEDPGVSEAPGDLAELLLARGRRDLARDILIRGLHASPGQPRLLGLRAATLADTADYRAVLEEARAWHARSPGDERLALVYAGLLAGSQRLAAAALYDSLVHAPAASDLAYAAAIGFWTSAGRLDVAESIADSGVARHPGSGGLWLAKGDIAAERQQWAEAAPAFRRAARLLPRPEAAELPLMDADVGLGDTAAAVGLLRRMAAHGAPRAALLAGANRAEALGHAGAADSVYRQLLRRQPDDVSALDGAAGIAAQRGDTADAVALYCREMATDSGAPWAPLALFRLERPAPARARELLLAAEWRGIAALQQAELSGAPSDRSAAAARTRLTLLVHAVLDTVVFETSWGPAELSQLRRAYPGSALLARYAAELAARRGNDSGAVAQYDALVRGAPADTALQEERAALLDRLGRAPEARDAYSRVLDLDPDDTTAFRALVRLDERAGRLDELLAQLQRLRIRRPDSHLLAVHEIEVLQRLGRLAEADSAARRLEGKHT